MEKLCTNKNRSYKNNEQINKQNINNSECFGVKFAFFLRFPILLTDVRMYLYDFRQFYQKK
jgi:hypothetical protein